MQNLKGHLYRLEHDVHRAWGEGGGGGQGRHGGVVHWWGGCSTARLSLCHILSLFPVHIPVLQASLLRFVFVFILLKALSFLQLSRQHCIFPVHTTRPKTENETHTQTNTHTHTCARTRAHTRAHTCAHLRTLAQAAWRDDVLCCQIASPMRYRARAFLLKIRAWSSWLS